MAKTKQQKYQHVFTLDNFRKNASGNVNVVPPDPNNVLSFGNKKSDEEIVYSSKFNLDVEELLNNSTRTRLALRNNKEGAIKKVPRRQNPWILYRRDKSADPRFVGMKSSMISQIVGKWWNEESEDVKESYAALARMAEARHMAKHKDFAILNKGISQDLFAVSNTDSTSSSFNSSQISEDQDMMDVIDFDSSEFEGYNILDNESTSTSSVSSSPQQLNYCLHLFNSLESPHNSELGEIFIPYNNVSQDMTDIALNFPTLDSIQPTNTTPSPPPPEEFQQFSTLDQPFEMPPNFMENVFLGSNFNEKVIFDDSEIMMPPQFSDMPLDYYGFISEDNFLELFKGSGSLQ
ncbi:5603_t:CDS:2 [Funneliformis caledonium]|uniref:5603_t:CDS:1 n=1 Tax=Funneliformis caledonium TaxID=1117310 RepID=A0A9N8YTQ3_9GLOM|nr:5603_t:CDS:2 [Funneliformis caledonium]